MRKRNARHGVRRAGCGERVLRHGPEAPVDDRSEAHAVPFTDEEKALHVGAPEEIPAAERDAVILGLARQAEEMGISVVNLINEALLAEIDVRRFEKWNGKTLEWRHFSRTIETARRLRAEHSAIDEEARAISQEIKGPFIILGRTPEESQSEVQANREALAAREARNEEVRKNLAEQRKALSEDWKALELLKEIIQKVPNAPACWRVRYALGWLRAPWLLRTAAKDLPRELTLLLGRIGQAIADPPKLGLASRKPTAREKTILNVWGMREYLGREARSEAAKSLGFRPSEKTPDAWETLEREARRYIARAQTKEPTRRRRQKSEPRPAKSGPRPPPAEGR